MAALVNALLAALAPPPAEEAAERARRLFEKHAVDAGLLDYLAFGDGADLLHAWKERRARLEAKGRPQPQDPQRLHRLEHVQQEQPEQVPQQQPEQVPQQHQQHQQQGEQQLPQEPPEGRRPVPPEQPAGPERTPSSYHGRQRITTAERLAERQVTNHFFAPGGAGSTAAARSKRAAQASAPVPPAPSAPAARSVAGGTAHPTLNGPRQAPRQADAPAALLPATPAAEPAPRLEGIFRSFNAEKGFGFIRCAAAEKDVFVHASELPKGHSEVGAAVQFELVFDPSGRPQARNVLFLSVQRFVGCLKSLGPTYGFIECAETRCIYGKDVYVQRCHLPTLAQVVDDAGRVDHTRLMSFSVGLSEKGDPQAKDCVLEEVEDVHSDRSDAKEKKAARW